MSGATLRAPPLPGNRRGAGTLLQAVLKDTLESVLVEVTPSKEIVWRLRLAGVSTAQTPSHFYKAQRVGP